MHVVAHNANGIQPEGILFFGALDGIQEHIAAGGPVEVEPAVVAAHSDMVAVVGL